MIKAICYDLDGVYFTPRGKKAFHENLVKLGVPESVVVHLLYKSEEMRLFVTGKMPEEEFWHYFREETKLKFSNKELTNLWVKEYEIDQEVRNTVLTVRENGYKTCVCTNNNPARIRGLEEKFHFLSDFDVFVTSYEVGYFKPTKEIFEALITATEIEANEIAYSDDNAERIQGAKDLGINTFLYENFEQFKKELINFGVNLD